jgi:glycosyltransferase involved in cell wall biosynthesis
MVKKVLNHVHSFKPDIIVSHDENAWNVYAAYAISRKLGVPWTAILNEVPGGCNYLLPWVKEVSSLNTLVKGNIKRIISKDVIRLLNKTTPIVVSKAIITNLRLVGYNLNNYIVLEVPLGVNVESINKMRTEDGQFDAIYVGRLVPEKGIYDLIKIWENVKRDVENARLCVVGRFYSAVDRYRVRKLIRKKRLLKNIVLAGFVREDKKFSIMKSSSVFVYPSRQDAFPLSVLEALACSIPVISYAIPAMLCYDTDAVIKVKIGDIEAMSKSIVRVLTDDNLYSNLKIIASSYCTRYTWENAVACELKAYEHILSSRY